MEESNQKKNSLCVQFQNNFKCTQPHKHANTHTRIKCVHYIIINVKKIDPLFKIENRRNGKFKHKYWNVFYLVGELEKKYKQVLIIHHLLQCITAYVRQRICHTWVVRALGITGE